MGPREKNDGIHRRLLLLATSLVVLSLAVAPADSQAAFTAPVTLSAPGQNASEAGVTVDPGGNAVFVWHRPDATTDCGGLGCSRVQARVRFAGGAFSTIQTLSAAGQNAGKPEVAVDPSGNAAFAWTRPDGTTDCGGTGCSRVQTRIRSAAGALTGVQTLSGAGQSAGEAQVAVDSSGNAVFAWQRPDGTTDCGGFSCSRIQARVRFAGGGLSAIQTLSAPGQGAGDPQVAVDSGGNAVFTWVRFDGTSNRVEARVRSSAGTLSATETLSDPGKSAIDPQVAVDPSGNAVFVWQRPDATTNCGGSGCLRIQARARSSGGTLSPTQGLSAGGQNASEPGVGVDSSGNAVFAWQRQDGTTDCGGSGCFRVQTRARSSGGILSAIQTLSGAGQSASDPDLVVDPAGNAVFVWSRFDGTNNRIEARLRLAAGSLGAIQTLSAAGQSASEPEVAVDPSGNAAAAWQRPDATTDCGGIGCSRIEAAIGP